MNDLCLPLYAVFRLGGGGDCLLYTVGGPRAGGGDNDLFISNSLGGGGEGCLLMCAGIPVGCTGSKSLSIDLPRERDIVILPPRPKVIFES